MGLPRHLLQPVSSSGDSIHSSPYINSTAKVQSQQLGCWHACSIIRLKTAGTSPLTSAASCSHIDSDGLGVFHCAACSCSSRRAGFCICELSSLRTPAACLALSLQAKASAARACTSCLGGDIPSAAGPGWGIRSGSCPGRSHRNRASVLFAGAILSSPELCPDASWCLQASRCKRYSPCNQHSADSG